MEENSISITPKPWGAGRRVFLFVRSLVIIAQLTIYRRVLGMDIGENVRISLRAELDFTNPRGIHIGDFTYVAFGAVIFTHDMCRAMHTDTYIGKNCFIGSRAIIMPGVRIGDGCIVGSGAVVTADVPSGSIAAGNPAKVVRSGIKTVQYGILEQSYARALAESEMREAEARKPPASEPL